jgi:small subunit ribosomal protein S1
MTDESFDNEKGEESFEDLFRSYTAGLGNEVHVGDRIRGPIISIGKESLFIDTGTKIDGVVDKAELLDDKGDLPYKEGDVLELYVVSFRGDEIRLSKAMTGAGSINALEEAFRNAIPVEGKVKGQIKGGYHVEIMQRRAFCPMSQMDLKFQESPEQNVGQTYRFLITQFEEKGKNIVVSRRDLLRKEQEKAFKKFIETLKVGDQVPGRVTKLMPYGAFVELLPGLEGMVHISEISWSRVEKASDVLTPQSTVTVKVLGMEPGEKPGSLKISLSIKQVTGDPWESVGDNFRIGDNVKGKVTRCANFGAFVEIAPGVEGLVHLSEMSYRKRVTKPEEVVKAGDHVPVIIKEIDLEKRRISLSIKDAEGDPWSDVPERYREGQRVEGVVEKRERFGYFVALEPGVSGLLPASRIKDSLKPSQLEKLREGDKVNVIVEEINPEERKITLAPGDSRDEEDWRQFAKREQKRSSVFGEKLNKALQKATKQKG